MLHLIGKIGALNRGNIVPPRQIKSACPPRLARARRNRHIDRYDQTRSCACPDRCSVHAARHRMKSRAYTIIDRCTANPIARLRPIPDTDRFELFYWSSVKGRWTTFGNLGRMKLMLESAHEIIEMIRCSASRAADENWPKSS